MKKSTASNGFNYSTPTIEEIQEMVSLCKNDKERGLITVYANTGFRLTECLLLDIGDVLTPDGSVKDSVIMRSEITKFSREREVFLTSEAKEAIRKVIVWNKEQGLSTDPNQPLWWTYITTMKPTYCELSSRKVRGKQIRGWFRTSRDSWYRLIWRTRPDKRIHTHSLRNFFARKTYLECKDLPMTQALLGHSYLTTTQIYVRPSREESFDKFRKNMSPIVGFEKSSEAKEEYVNVLAN